MKQMPNIKTIDELFEATHIIGGGKSKDFLERKADENLSATNDTNWMDSYGLKNEIKDFVVNDGKLLKVFQKGFEGNNLPQSYPVPYDTTKLYFQGATEWEDSGAPSYDPHKPTDSKGTLTMKDMELSINVTDTFLRTATDKQMFEYLKNAIGKAAERTILSMIINGDSETGATGNVNSDDQAPATTFATTGAASDHRLLLDHGIRENAITNSKTVDVGAFDSDDIMSVVAKLDEKYQEELADIAILANTKTYNKMITEDALKLAVNSRNAAIDGGVPNPWDMPFFKTGLVPTTEADGKVSATAGNNTLGQFVAVYVPAVRWGFGKEFNLEVERKAGKGYRIVGTMAVSFVILDVANTCAAGINVTIA